MNKSHIDRGKVMFWGLSLLVLVFLLYFLFYPEGSTREALKPQEMPSSIFPSEEMPAIPEVVEEQAIQGEIRISPALAKSIKKGAVLFVMAKPVGKEEGLPVAVTRVSVNTFPVSYSLSLTHGMMGESEATSAQKVRVSARLDQDGNASTRQPGDLVGAYPEPVALGATHISFELAEEIPPEKERKS